jgi:DNA-binding FadR family transcriptional regulator
MLSRDASLTTIKKTAPATKTVKKVARKTAAKAQAPAGLTIGGGEDLHIPKLSHMVAARLRAQIASGKLAAGSLLMPENKLLELFNVSRPTLREALRILEAESLISIGRGMRAGALILGPNIKKAAEYITFMLVSEGVTMRDLHQARTFLEPPIIASLRGKELTAAALALRADVDRIGVCLEKDDFLGVIAGTNRFHETLARASGNKAIALLVGILQSISDDAYAAVVSTDETSSVRSLRRNMEKTVSGYVALCDLLEKGKADEASKFWNRYMERALEFLEKSGLGTRRILQASA